MTALEDTQVVTCFLRNRGEVLLLRRSEAVGSYRGKWGAVAGYAEGSAEQAATREIAEETGLADSVELVRQGESFPVEAPELEKRWIVHPFLFDCGCRDFKLDRESVEGEWVSPTEILRRDTVPELWTSYSRVAPSVASVNADTEHGAAYISLRALEVLRDRAALLAVEQIESSEAWEALAKSAVDLTQGHPTMAVLANRVNRVMHFSKESRSAEAVEHHAHSSIESAAADDEAAAGHAANLVAGRAVLTLSRSGTVLDALCTATPKPTSVAVAESHPGGEGVGVAERLIQEGLSVTLLPDADIVPLLEKRGVDLVLIGADSLLPSGGVVNKVGSCGAALAARRAGIPFYSVAATDKLRVNDDSDVIHSIFERVPADAVTGIVTDRGVLRQSDLQAVAVELKDLTDWRS
jgi:translation initiation factor 2B subunit (eIF-2B alpha/beta/delta family)/8-oxo-dGTP pyrophosphatase MutT (NUDIX family)